MMLGQNETKYNNYEHKISFWQMVENPVLIEQAAEQTKNQYKPAVGNFMEDNHAKRNKFKK